MQKTSTIIIFFLFLGAALAGCTQEEINQGCNDPKANNFGEPAPEGANIGDDTCNYDPIPMPDFEENEIDEANSTNDSESTQDEPTIKEYSVEEVLELIGVDGSPEASLNLDAPKEGYDKFGIQLIMNVPAKTIPSEITQDIEQNIEIISTNKYDNLEQKISHDIQAKLPMGSWSINVIMSETQAAHPDIENAGVINKVVTNEVNFQPEAKWLIDYSWDYYNLNWDPNIEAIAEIFSPLEDCNGHGFLMEEMDNLGQHCMCDEGYDWENGDMLTCISEDEITENEDFINDETEIPINIPEPTAEELSATEWSSIIDEIAGTQSFSGIVNMENTGNWSIIVSIIPTIPPKLTGLIMSNESESYDITFTYNDEIKIDFIYEDTEGWNRGVSDLSFEIERTDTVKVIEDDGKIIIEGCTDSEANNFNQNANTDDGTCNYDSPSKPKILALHGGGDSAQGLQSQRGMQDLMEELTEFEFVFVDTPEDNGVWVRDPPGGKGEGTDDPNWADTSINFLDNYIEENGPFYGLLGYSQGAAMIPIYLAYSDSSFEKVIHFNGYLETGHQGLMDTINTNSPFTEEALIFEGEDDTWFGYGSAELDEHYTNSIHLVGDAGHHLPYSNDRAFDDVVSFFRENTEPISGCTDPSALNYNNEAEEDNGSCEYEIEEEQFEINTTLYANLSGNIEVPTSQLKLHLHTPEGIIPFNFNQQGLIGEWTDSQLNSWYINWECENEDSNLQSQILIYSGCKIIMNKTWIGYSNDSSEIKENDVLNFQIQLFDNWADDYTSSESVPSFTFSVSLIALLGACLKNRNKRVD